MQLLDAVVGVRRYGQIALAVKVVDVRIDAVAAIASRHGAAQLARLRLLLLQMLRREWCNVEVGQLVAGHRHVPNVETTLVGSCVLLLLLLRWPTVSGRTHAKCFADGRRFLRLRRLRQFRGDDDVVVMLLWLLVVVVSV